MTTSDHQDLDKKLDKILQYAVDHAYEVMDSKSFENPFIKPIEQIKSLFQSEITKSKDKSYLDGLEAGIEMTMQRYKIPKTTIEIRVDKDKDNK